MLGVELFHSQLRPNEFFPAMRILVGGLFSFKVEEQGHCPDSVHATRRRQSWFAEFFLQCAQLRRFWLHVGCLDLCWSGGLGEKNFHGTIVLGDAIAWPVHDRKINAAVAVMRRRRASVWLTWRAVKILLRKALSRAGFAAMCLAVRTPGVLDAHFDSLCQPWVAVPEL